MLGLCSAFLLHAQTGTTPVSGGPDQFGYTWTLTPNVPNNWIDIANTGTVVTGLGDDNVVGPINLGFNFKYYWNDYSDVYLGSNGYLMFGQGKLIASSGAPTNGFLPVPTSTDQNHNFIAGYLGDLTMVTAQGNPAPNARVVYQTIGNKFVLSFINVPWWNGNVNPTQISGSNTFQFVLDGSDNSITLNYKGNRTGFFTGYTNWVRIGIENITGQLGLQCRGGSMTAASSTQLNNATIRFNYPSSTSYQFRDVSTIGVFNKENHGITIPKGSPTTIKGVVKNTGTVDVTNFTARAVILDEDGNGLYNSQVTIPFLGRGRDTLISFPAPFTEVQNLVNYICLVTATLTGDQYSPNNSKSSKISIIDTANGSLTIRHTKPTFDPQNVGVGSQNSGMYMETPVTPVALRKVSVDVLWTNGNALPPGIPNWATDSVTPMDVKLYLGNGPNKSVGSLIDSFRIVHLTNMYDIDTVGFVLGTSDTTFYILRHTMTLSRPIIWKEGPIYAGVFMDRTTRFLWNGVAAETDNVASYRSLEMPGGVWGENRNRDSVDYAISLIVTRDTSNVFYPAANITASGVTTFCQGGSVTLTSNPATSYLWSNGATTQSISVSTGGAYSVILTYPNGSTDTSNVINVVVNPKPTATITANPANATACAGGAGVQLTANTSPAYLWSTGATTATITATTSGNYWVRIANSFGCVDTSDFQAVTIVTPDTALTVTGSSISVNASNATFQWFNCTTNQPIAGATDASYSPSEAGTYAVEVTQNGCTLRSRCVVFTSTTDLASGFRFGMSPNPARDQVQVQCTEACKLVVINQVGQVVLEQNVTAGQQIVNINHLAPGIYSVKAISAKGMVRQQLVRH